jgi:glycyl-tRNA synthetase beta chain
MTAMVNEFPELEGTMGYYYAKHAGEIEAVALALKEQYMPRFAADALPPSHLGQALSLADRLDTLAGAFAIGLKPTGTKDPFKLRRHALAVVRLLKTMKTDKPIHLSVLLRYALDNYRLKHVIGDDVFADLMNFILDRLPSSYQGMSIGQDLISAVRACQAECLFDFDQRIIALDVFRHRPEVTSLSAASKRVEHLLLQQTDVLDVLDETNLATDEEKNLLHHIKQIEAHYARALESTAIPSHKEYTEFLTALAGLREVVDLFFEHVMVMVDDLVLRRNRLAILQKLHYLFQKVAKISIMK